MSARNLWRSVPCSANSTEIRWVWVGRLGPDAASGCVFGFGSFSMAIPRGAQGAQAHTTPRAASRPLDCLA